MPGSLPVFWGCRALAGDASFEMSVRGVLRALGLSLEDLSPQACCGEPIRSLSITASCYLSIRLLALAASGGHEELLIPCSKGYYMARWSLDLMSDSREVYEGVSRALSSEGLDVGSLARPLSLVDLLYREAGPEGLASSSEELGLEVALHPGCYLLRVRPGTGEGLDELGRLRELLGAVGVRAPYYPGMLDCCGGSLSTTRPDAAATLAGSKLKAVRGAGLRCLVLACPGCFEMLDKRQEEALKAVGAREPVPVFYFTQLLGLALGLGEEELGLQFNSSPVSEILSGVSR